MLSTFLLAGWLLQTQQEQVLFTQITLPMQANSPTSLMLKEFVAPIDPPKKSPKKFGEEKLPWQFPWCIQGLAAVNGYGKTYFQVFGQEHKALGDQLEPVARMLLRLWDFNYKKLKLSHNPHFQDGLVEVFLCFGGNAGGQQIFDHESEHNKKTGKDEDIPANTIYIYDVNSFTDPVEMAREVAHEYGHATIWPIGGYKAPEDWANGYLGEKLFLRWMRDAMAKGELGPIDAMGATKEGLDKWLALHVDPLIEQASQVLPTESVMADTSAAGMNEYIGLSLYIDTIYPDAVFSRSLGMTSPYDPKGYPPATVLAAEEPDQIKLKIPSYLYGKLIWIPLGTGKLSGTAILKRDASGWVQIKAAPGAVSVVNTH